MFRKFQKGSCGRRAPLLPTANRRSRNAAGNGNFVIPFPRRSFQLCIPLVKGILRQPKTALFPLSKPKRIIGGNTEREAQLFENGELRQAIPVQIAVDRRAVYPQCGGKLLPGDSVIFHQFVKRFRKYFALFPNLILHAIYYGLYMTKKNKNDKTEKYFRS